MSSTKADLTDEQKEAITKAEAVVADPDSTEEEKAEAESVLKETKKEEVSEEDKAEEEELLANHKKQVFDGMVKGEVSKIANGETTLDQVNGEKLRAAVEEKLKAISQPKKTDDVDAIVQRAKEETKTELLLDQAKALLPEEQRDTFVSEYEELKTKGYTATEALDKSKRIYQVPSLEDKQREEDLNSMRAVKGGSVSPNRVSGAYDPVEHEKFNAQQKKLGLREVSKEAFMKVS